MGVGYQVHSLLEAMLKLRQFASSIRIGRGEPSHRQRCGTVVIRNEEHNYCWISCHENLLTQELVTTYESSIVGRQI